MSDEISVEDEHGATFLAKTLRYLLKQGAVVVEFEEDYREDELRLPSEVRIKESGRTVDVLGHDYVSPRTLDPSRVENVRVFDGWGYETTKTFHKNGTPVEVRVRAGDEDSGHASAGDRKVAHDSALNAVGEAFEWDERKIP